MESVTSLPFQVLFSEDGNQAQDMTHVPHVTVSIYSSYTATRDQNEK